MNSVLNRIWLVALFAGLVLSVQAAEKAREQMPLLFEDDFENGLDKWEIVALRRLRVLERPGDTDVRIVARGDALFRRVGAEAQRGPELSFTGQLVP